MLKLKCQRELFDIPEDIIYLNNAGASPLLKSAVTAGLAGLEIKTAPWKITNHTFFDIPDMARQKFAQLIKCNPHDIAIIPSATYGIESALKNMSFKTGDQIVIASEEFPSIVLPIQKLAALQNLQVITVPRPMDGDWTSAFLKHMNSKTKLVAFGTSHWTDGSLLSAPAVSKKARDLGAFVLIDACQSVGAMPLNINESQPDFLVAPTYKWLMGPYSFGFMYVNPKHHHGQGLEEYWASRVGAEDFSSLTKYETKYKGGAYRFDMGERSQFINAPIAIAAIDQILTWGPENMCAYTEPLCDFLSEEARKKGYHLASKQFQSSHFIGFKSKSGFSDQLKKNLESQKITVSFRGDWMRVSVSVYNTLTDMEKLIACL